MGNPGYLLYLYSHRLLRTHVMSLPHRFIRFTVGLRSYRKFPKPNGLAHRGSISL